MSSTLRTRLAPTPSGLLHPGNAVSFLLTWAIARAQGGSIFLRIDDLDAARMRPEYLEDIFRSLDWLGIDYDEGPDGPDDFAKHYSQHLRLDQYYQAINQLKEQGPLFACTCSRKQIRQLSANGIYPGTCRYKKLDWENPQTAWRLHVPQTVQIGIPEWKALSYKIPIGQSMGDTVLKQKNGLPAYQIASLVDDLQWNINFIVRGKDLLDSSAIQLYLTELLSYPEFKNNTFFHHNLLTDDSGEKLSKTKGAGSLQEWRESNKSPVELYQFAGKLLGINHTSIENKSDLIAMVKIFIES